LNELLLLVNKDRMERAFFDYFFRAGCTVGMLGSSVLRFQKVAMLCFGNFIYAYRTLAQAPSVPALESALGEWARRPEDLTSDFAARSPKLVDIELIARGDTPFVGYISAGEVVAEGERCAFLQAHLPGPDALPGAGWAAYEQAVVASAGPAERQPLRAIVANYRKRHPGATIAQFADYLREVAAVLRAGAARLDSVRQMATRNQNIYLTWDDMDVYFATSMRKRWEFEDLFDFVNGLVADPQLAGLGLRPFDPTQAFTKDRVAKGLVESLMLKRAKCTVYSVQDTDTLGKDSELAATLAQGKPVIAYVPTVDVEARATQLSQEDPATIQERLRFVLFADDQFAQSVSREDYDFVRAFQAIEQFEADRIWRTVPDPQGRTGTPVPGHCVIRGADLQPPCQDADGLAPAGNPGEPGDRCRERGAGRADRSAMRGFAAESGDERPRI
jgi:hypothetical protein